jgi:hypothetical protein
MLEKMNWFGLAAGITTILLIVSSLFIPWWKFQVGKDPALVEANVSPIYTDFNFIGNAFTIPLIWAINLASILYLTAGGIIMLVYSIKPTKLYSKRLLGFSYKKPLYFIIFFIIGLIALSFILKGMFNLDVPLSGSAQTTLPSNLIQGVSISVFMSAEFLWPFWLAVLTAGLCIGAKLYHRKLVPVSMPNVAKQ